uniref:C2H2-type domain-containing protein n=1 Tax=Glossina austeni TaxID=7395 RepID=A0A1A9ULQ2_GLOAU
MSFFSSNICHFDGCGIAFPSESDLMLHIDGTHINYDREIIEKMEQSRPASPQFRYALRSMTGGAREETVCPSNNATDADSTPKSSAKRRSSIMRSTNRSNTPTGSEMKENERVGSDSENSNDSWTTKEYSTKFIMRYGSEYSKSKNGKPYVCPVPGCEKRYKTIIGIRYHAKKGHRDKVRKRFMCPCGKCYRDAHGLKSHALMIHKSSPKNVLSIRNVSGPVEGAEFTLDDMPSCSSACLGRQIVTTVAVHREPLTTVAANNCSKSNGEDKAAGAGANRRDRKVGRRRRRSRSCSAKLLRKERFRDWLAIVLIRIHR